MIYEFDKAKFLMENFDGEAVLVNTVSGYYYSLSGSGPDILALLSRSLSVDEVAETLAGGAPNLDKVRASVTAFTARLVDESILIPSQSSRPEKQQTHAAAVVTGFTPPELTKFEDMREILLLDPVHQVDEVVGWPKAR